MKVPAEVIQLAAHEVDPEPDKAESAVGTSALKRVKAQVTRSRMTLLLLWLPMLNSMSLCKFRMLQ